MSTSDEKRCTSCGFILPLSSFGIDRSLKSGRTSSCKNCLSIRNSAGQRKMKYGISSEEYDTRILVNGGSCEICGGTNLNGRALAVDHDHGSGQVRGLLCNNCNAILGLANDSVETLTWAIEYLQSRSE